MSQPRVAVGKKSGEEGAVHGGFEGLRRETVSGTERPRLHFPPRVLVLRDWEGGEQRRMG